MNRFYDKVGYAIQEETRPSVWEDRITEQLYYGELVNKGYRDNYVADNVHQDLRLDSDIEIIANPFAIQHFSKIRYVCYGGTRWIVTGVRPDYPRIHLTIGGIYNGPTAEDGLHSSQT